MTELDALQTLIDGDILHDGQIEEILAAIRDECDCDPSEKRRAALLLFLRMTGEEADPLDIEYDAEDGRVLFCKAAEYYVLTDGEFDAGEFVAECGKSGEFLIFEKEDDD